VKTETPPIRATAKIRRVESLLPDARQDIVAASAMAIKRTAGMIQSAPHNRPISTAIGTWSQSTTSNALLVVSRNVARSSLSIVIPNPQAFGAETLLREAGGDRPWINDQPDAGLA
jgi:hypothetical protein